MDLARYGEGRARRPRPCDGRVPVIRCVAEEVEAFEELGDLGPYWAFQVAENEIFCVGGQEYLDLPNFPNSDFEIVKSPLPNDPVRRLGRRLEPVRTIPASVHKNWDGPCDGDGYEGKLADLEKILASR